MKNAQRGLAILSLVMFVIGLVFFTMRLLGATSLWTAIGCNGAFIVMWAALIILYWRDQRLGRLPPRAS